MFPQILRRRFDYGAKFYGDRLRDLEDLALKKGTSVVKHESLRRSCRSLPSGLRKRLHKRILRLRRETLRYLYQPLLAVDSVWKQSVAYCDRDSSASTAAALPVILSRKRKKYVALFIVRVTVERDVRHVGGFH